jgi:hypothetical protein
MIWPSTWTDIWACRLSLNYFKAEQFSLILLPSPGAVFDVFTILLPFFPFDTVFELDPLTYQ